jgi:hypothetical protein
LPPANLGGDALQLGHNVRQLVVFTVLVVLGLRIV